MRKQLFVLGIALLAVFFSNAQEKRALLIAVDKYTPPETYKAPENSTARSEFRDLDGCLNDARSIQSIIVSRFEFVPANVDTLFNETATRSAMVKAMNALLDKSKANDVAFIYYAGHGSQVPNSLSKEVDKKDESMVPSDTWKEGVEDIRDKELAKIYNAFIDKGVKLTVILDCCHSGSLSRGDREANPGKFRFIADANYDAKDASQPVVPETRKEGTFLIMSAAQDNEFAQEQRDEFNLPHGAFTIAFTKALEQQSVNASVLNLFTSIRAILKSNGKKQEPVLGGSSERQQQTLFGLSKGSLPDKSKVAVVGFENGKVLLQGGFALGLYKQNELVKFSDKDSKDTLVKVRIDTVLGVSKSRATILKGTAADLKAGEYLTVTNWVSSAAPLLKLYVPSGTMSYDQVAKLAQVNKELKSSGKVKWINDLKKADPYMSIFYDNDKCYSNIDGKIKELKDISAAAILQLCKDSTLYFELPPAKELTAAVKKSFAANKNIVFGKSASDANYVLYGTINDEGKTAYGFRRGQSSARDSLESMPLQTNNFVLENNTDKSLTAVADNLYEYALRLSKIRGWLNLAGPRSGINTFPFHLELINTDINKPVDTKVGSKIGDNISLHIAADKNYKTIKNISTKYIYVFAIDQFGKMSLGFPDAGDGNVHNKFPYKTGEAISEDEELFKYEVSEPSGTDNIFLLATDEPISNYGILFNQDGVRAVETRGANNPLADLLNIGNSGTRSGFDKKAVPSSWVLYRLPVKSRY